ncbi:MAG TPA: SusC/RagA family TonB-linked outer membrane protein, partial [Longimicrobiales bacterium]|nr:SusC/RagA family TonB-linked outer membrane protein [Longimicrobiales bacterium]
GLPIAGATVQVTEARVGALSGADGRYRIANVPAGTHTISAQILGYVTMNQSVTVGAGGPLTIDFRLQVAPVALEQVVVTGTAAGERLRAIGNSITKVNAAEEVALGAPPTMTTLLNARAPGVVVNFATGRLGAGQSINIRGRSSVGLGDSPLIYIDGVRINSSTGSGPTGGALGAQNGAIAGRLNDINPSDIESIEVIKGPAAATIYGTEASNGVIQIITKKGVPGARPVFTLQTQQGALWFRDAADRLPTNFFRDPATGNVVTWNAVEQEEQRGSSLFRTGQTRVYEGSVSGGFQQARYYLSSSYQNDFGVEPNNGFKHFSTHANLNVTPSEKLDVGASLHFVDQRARLGTDAGASAMLGAVGGHALVFPASRGFALGFPPELTWALYDNTQDIKRFTGSGTVNYRPTGWMNHRLMLGLDHTTDDSRALERYAPPELRAFPGLTPTAANGRIAQTLRRLSVLSLDYAGSARAEVTPALSLTTSVGLQAFRDETNQSFLGGLGFAGAGVYTVSATATPLSSTQTQILNTTVGGYAQEKLAWRDRLFVTGALRVDNNSAFGEDFKWVTYPKFDVSWVASDEPFWRWSSVVNTLRLRAAYGESGRSPNVFSALRTFNPVQGPGGTSAITPGSAGNPNLKPERGKELEVGFEAELLRRLSIDFTYYDKTTVDVIVNQAVAPSTGFPGNIPLNLGQVDNSGIELRATLQALERENLHWEVTGSIATNGDEIKDLGVVPGAITSAGAANRVGYPIGGIWTRRVVSADRDPTTNQAINVLCDGGPGNAPVACASAPFVFIGTTTPKQSGAIANTLTIRKRLRLYGLIDFQRGNVLWNVNEMLRCIGGFGARLCEANYFPEKYSTIYLAETAGNALAQGIIDQYYQDASYFKLREVSATYMVPERWLRGLSAASITIAARELATWTDYRGLDPDVSAAVDQALVPQLTRLTAILNIRF